MPIQLEKVTVSQEVADAITWGLTAYKPEDLLITVIETRSVERGSYFEILCEIPFDTLVKAAYIGYETSADKVAEYIRTYTPREGEAATPEYAALNRGRREGARAIAEIFGVELPDIFEDFNPKGTETGRLSSSCTETTKEAE